MPGLPSPTWPWKGFAATAMKPKHAALPGNSSTPPFGCSRKPASFGKKTDAVTGDVAGGEYEAAPMLGWSAGVFVALHEYLKTPYLPGASSKR
ncbi:MAG: hypothetical protein WCO68_02295 [Verrucomicrobiota bacterium]